VLQSGHEGSDPLRAETRARENQKKNEPNRIKGTTTSSGTQQKKQMPSNQKKLT